MKSTVEIIKDRIKELGIKQVEVAHLVNLPPSTISSHLTGRRGISVESLRAYQRGLGIPCEELLGVEDAANE